MKTIIILFDSLNRHFLPPYGNKEVYAPNFERLSRKAITFDNSYVGSMPCIPARRELHTGRKNFLHREWGPLEPFDDSMPDLLKKNGIYSHLISDHIHYWEEGGGNYHTKYSSWEIVRGQEGDHWKGEVENPVIPDVVRIPLNQKGTGPTSMWRNDWVNRNYIHMEEDQPMFKVFDLGRKFIKKNFSENNWFLQIETFDPHEPFMVMDHYLDMYNKDSYKGKHYDWPRGQIENETAEEIEYIINQYRALVTMCDHYLGTILDLMDQLNLWKDTLLIVGTDHGFMLGEHGYWAKNHVPYFNEVANTPLFIFDPRIHSSNAGARRKSIVQMIDWAPTILDFFNIEVPKNMEGKPLRKTLENDSMIRSEALFGVFSGHVNITDGEYVYMRAAEPNKLNYLFNYTLMPVQIHNSFTVEELAQSKFVDGFDFTKGLKVLRVPSKDKYGVNRFGSMLFDVIKDPNQLQPLDDREKEQEMLEKLVKLMKENDAPLEQYERLGIDVSKFEET